MHSLKIGAFALLVAVVLAWPPFARAAGQPLSLDATLQTQLSRLTALDQQAAVRAQAMLSRTLREDAQHQHIFMQSIRRNSEIR